MIDGAHQPDQHVGFDPGRMEAASQGWIRIASVSSFRYAPSILRRAELAACMASIVERHAQEEPGRNGQERRGASCSTQQRAGAAETMQANSVTWLAVTPARYSKPVGTQQRLEPRLQTVDRHARSPLARRITRYASDRRPAHNQASPANWTNHTMPSAHG
jgi:hypothetical protein